MERELREQRDADADIAPASAIDAALAAHMRGMEIQDEDGVRPTVCL